NIKWAVVAAEDQKYWQHPGIDLVAIAEAYQEMEEGERVRGASTITQQVAKNLFLSSDKNYFRKGIEAGLALTIDALWGKERVLEMYLNIVEFGPGVYGIGKASNHFFNKDAKYLKDEESARMAAVLPNPKRMRVEPASPYVQKRKDWILRNMMNLSGIAYYNYPEPEVVKDSVQTDSMFIFDIPFINRVEISGIGLSLSDARAVDKANKDSSKTDSVMSRDLRF
ncbi:MAG TPA: monofunctional biosynthetic peptidoglycan transglycosylase, partial [Balneola sp.]|nr:monofunctional biosynthetic peptidoglycan transglycosylase [Balneola sp.]